MKHNHMGDCLAFSLATALITISVTHSVMITNLLDCWAAHLRLADQSRFVIPPIREGKDGDLTLKNAGSFLNVRGFISHTVSCE